MGDNFAIIEDHVGQMIDAMQQHGAQLDDLRRDMEDLGEAFNEVIVKVLRVANAIMQFKYNSWGDRLAHLEIEMSSIISLTLNLTNKIAVLKKATKKVKVRVSKPFDGERSSKVLRNFYRDVEEYLD